MGTVLYPAPRTVTAPCEVPRAGADVPLDTTVSCLWTQISPVRYGASFYYGRFKNMVLIYMFEPDPNLRFAPFAVGWRRYTRAKTAPTRLGISRSSVPDYKVGQEYKLNMRSRSTSRGWTERMC